MPSRPLAPIAAAVLNALVPALQLLGAVAGIELSPMTWIGTEEASSPAIRTSALRTAPQVYELTNWLQLATVTPPCCDCGNVSVKAGWNSRNPVEPVSTHTWSIVWQWPVPGTVPGTYTLIVT